MLIWAYISSTLVKCVLSASVDEKQHNKLIEVWLLKQGHCTEYVTGVTVSVEILKLKSRSYKYSWNPGLSEVCFAGKETKEGKESDFIVLKITYEMEISLSFQVMLVQRDLAWSFAWSRSVGCSKTYSKLKCTFVQQASTQSKRLLLLQWDLCAAPSLYILFYCR